MAFRLWFVRAHGPVLCAVLTAVSLAVILSNVGWELQWFWATSRAMTPTIVVAPVLAGATAFLVQRYLSPSARILTAAAPRGAAGVLVLTAAPWSAALVAITVGFAYVAMRTTPVVGGFDVPAWLVVHGIAALTAAALFGLVVGVWVPSLAAGPLAAIVAYVLPILAIPLGVEGLMAAGGASGPAFGMEPDPGVHATMVLLNLALGLLCAVVAVARLRPVRRRWWYAAGALAVVVLVAAGSLAAMDPRLTKLRPTGAAPVCVGDGTRVCGPADARPILEIAQRDIATARDVLAGRGLEATDRYAYYPPPDAVGTGVGLLVAEPSAVRDGHLGRWDLAVTIATPSACPEYFADLPPEELLDAQARLASWVSDALERQAAPAGADVLATYEALRTCDATALPAWAFEAW